MKESLNLQIVPTYHAAINVVTFFTHGIKKSKRCISEATLLGTALLALFLLCSCRTATFPSGQAVPAEQRVTAIADKVWAYSSSACT